MGINQSGQVSTVCDPGSGPFAQKGIIWKVGEIWTKSLSVLVLVFQFWGKFEMALKRTIFENEMMLVKHYRMTDI